MAHFDETDAGEAFIASAQSRGTSPEILRAIAFFARNLTEAETLWGGGGFGKICNPSDLWEHVTNNGLHEANQFFWGKAGYGWWDEIKAEEGV